MKRFVITLVLAVISFLVLVGDYRYAHLDGYKTGLNDGVSMTVEGCYNSGSDGAVIYNGITGHGLICQGVDIGKTDSGPGIHVLTPPKPDPDVPVPESDAEIQKKLKDPRQS